MKQPVVLAVLTLLSFLVFATDAASAHVLKTDGTIGAVLHINPDDNPATGSPTSYTLYFTDTTDKFSLPRCNCTVAITEDGQTVTSRPLAATSALTSNDTYTFTKPGVYDLRVSGTPKQAGTFQPFTLTYLVRVEARNGSGGTQPFPALLWAGMAMSIGLILLAAYKSEHTGT